MRAILFLLSVLLISNGSALAAGKRCGVSELVCSEGLETRLIDGMEVTRTCWKWAVNYACIQDTVTETCSDLVNRGGALLGSNCVQGVVIDSAFHCIDEQREYTFVQRPEDIKKGLDCSGKQYCVNGNCFDVGSAPDGDFAKAVAGMEALREAGVYLDEKTFEVFKGQDNRCGKNVAQNCCKGTNTNVSGLTNLAIMGGSAYAFDVLGVGSGNSAVFGLGFDPTTFALAMAVMVVQELIKCDKPETLLAVKRQKRLCVHIGEYCSRRINLGFTKVCVSRKETYCCFNSKISRLINEHARKVVVGMSWGTPEAPHCNGLTIPQLQSLDLSAIDFSEIYEDIVPKMPNQGVIVQKAEDKLKCHIDNTCNGPPPPPSCKAPWGAELAEGQSVVAYKQASAQMPDTCHAENRKCTAGQLSGSFTHQNCESGCGQWEKRVGDAILSCTQCPGDLKPDCEVIANCDKNNNCIYK